MLSRRGEPEGVHFRCSRYFSINYEWFAATRETDYLGPFPNRDHAELALAWQLASGQLPPKRSPASSQTVTESSDRPPTPLEILMKELYPYHRMTKERGLLAACALARQRLEDIDSLVEEPMHANLKKKAIRFFLGEADV